MCGVITGTVYLITSPTGKKYVGSTRRKVEERFEEYYKLECKTQPRLYRSFIKYGCQNHTFEVIWEGLFELMYRMEHLLGLEHKVLDKSSGLNCRLPKYDDVPGLMSECTKDKISKSGKGRTHSEYSKLKISESTKGKRKSEEHASNISKAKKGVKQRPEVVQKMAASKRGVKQSPEAIRKSAQSRTGLKRSEDSCKKIRGGENWRAIPVINIITGQLFGCIKDLVKFLNKTEGYVSYHLYGKSKINALPDYRFLNEDLNNKSDSRREELNTPKAKKTKVKRPANNAIKVINLETGEIYDSVTNLAKLLKISPTTLMTHLENKVCKNKFPMYRFVDVSLEKFPREDRKRELRPNSIIDIETLEVFYYVKDLSKKVGIPVTTLKRHLKANKYPNFCYIKDYEGELPQK